MPPASPPTGFSRSLGTDLPLPLPVPALANIVSQQKTACNSIVTGGLAPYVCCRSRTQVAPSTSCGYSQVLELHDFHVRVEPSRVREVLPSESVQCREPLHDAPSDACSATETIHIRD